MGLVLRTAELPAQDRVEVVRDAIWSTVLPVEIEHAQPPHELDLVCRLTVAGPLNFSSARSQDNRLHRTARLAAVDHEPLVFLAVQVSGTTRVAQGDAQSVLHAGDMVVYDSTRPYSVVNDGPTELHYFQVPRQALALPLGALDQLVGRRIGADNNPLAALAAPFFSSLGTGDVLDRPDAATAVVPASIELLRALLTTHLADPVLARQPLEDTLVLRVQKYVQEHLRERDLTAARIAAAHHVSERHLYATMARAGLSVHRTIQSQRLEGCRRDLRDPRCAHLAVATVGARWGFVDPSHFGRAFRRAYGMTPNEWRGLER